MLSRYLLFGFGFLFFVSGCNSQKKVAGIKDWNGNSLQFGSGGGFTGTSTHYTLLENGQLFVSTDPTGTAAKELASVEAKKASAVFSLAKKYNWASESVSRPGNMTYHIAYKTANKHYDFTWGESNYSPPGEIAQLYKELTSLISSPKQ